MSASESICDYCNAKYSDKRSLKIHEIIHTDEEIESFSTFSDYLPKAKQLLPRGMRSNRTSEINYKKIVTNSLSNGKLSSKTLFVSEAIEELLYLCKKFPLSVDSSCDKAHKMPISISSSSIDSASVCSSDFETSLVTSPRKPTFNESESALESVLDQNEAHYKDAAERNRTDSPEMISNENSSPDSGYDSPPEEKNYNESEISGFRSAFEIKGIIKDLVSRIAIVSDDGVAEKLTSDPGKLKPSIENSAPTECAIPSGLETSVSVDETVFIDTLKSATDLVFSMPKIPC